MVRRLLDTPELTGNDDNLPSEGDDQRAHPRHTLPARCWIADEEHTLYLKIHDVSRGGISVRAPVPFPPERPVDLELELPDGERVRARGEVVWVQNRGREPASPDTLGDPPPRMGARFLEILEGEEALDRALKRRP